MRNSAGRFLVGISCVLVGLVVTRAEATAVSSREPGPTITLISARGRGKVVDVTVFFKRPVSQSNSAVLSTQVKVGNRSCIATGRATRCIVKNVSNGRTVKVLARERSRRGFSAWGSVVSFKVVAGRIWRPKPTPTGGGRPLVPGGVSTTLPTGTTAPSNSQTLRFDVSTAIAFALSETNIGSTGVRKASAGSNLGAIGSDGRIRDAVVAGEARIKRYLIAPNDKLYIEFSDYPIIEGSPCLLAEVSRTTGLPTCIERDTGFLLVSPGQRGGFSWCPGQCGSSRSLVNDIQFDDRGAVYYMGIPNPKSRFPDAVGLDDVYGYGFADDLVVGKLKASVGTVIRRYLNGVKTDFGLGSLYLGTRDEPGFSPGDVENKIMLGSHVTNFVVFGDGTVLIDQVLSTRPENPTINPANCEFHRLDRWSTSGVRQAVAGIVPLLEERNGAGGCLEFLVNSMNSDPDVFFLSPLSLIKVDSRTVVAIGQPRFEIQRIGASQTAHMFKVEEPFEAAEEIPYVSKPPTASSSRIQNPNFMCSNDLNSAYRDYIAYVCQKGAAMIRGAWKTPSGEWFAVIGQSSYPSLGIVRNVRPIDGSESLLDWDSYDYGSGVLIQLAPSVRPTRLGLPDDSTDLVRIEAFLPILDSIVASGVDASGRARSFLYNTQSDTARQILGPSDGIRPTHFAFDALNNRLLVVGSASNDGRTIGFIDLASGRYTGTDSTKSSLYAVRSSQS
jgi:hypothetical protein